MGGIRIPGTVCGLRIDRLLLIGNFVSRNARFYSRPRATKTAKFQVVIRDTGLFKER